MQKLQGTASSSSPHLSQPRVTALCDHLCIHTCTYTACMEISCHRSHRLAERVTLLLSLCLCCRGLGSGSLRQLQMCSPACPRHRPLSHPDREDASEGSMKCKCSWFKKKMKFWRFAQETARGRRKAAECLSLKCKEEIFFLRKSKKSLQGDSFVKVAGE